LIITDKFVFLHYPKTGGLFITDVLKKVHAKKKWFMKPPMCQELMLPNVKRIYGANVYNQHGAYEQIPEEHRMKPIISCIRNPFDRYVSTFEYRSWLQRQPGELEKIMKQYPAFPELTFEQYLSFINIFDIANRTYSDQLKLDIGVITYSFIQFFFKDPNRIILNLNEAYLNSDKYKDDMPEIIFLRTENLNLDLYNVLLKFGYYKPDISFIMNENKVNVTPHRKTNQNWREYFNRNLYDFVKFKERFILKLFPEYNNEPVL
jgi:hypothetical protein